MYILLLILKGKKIRPIIIENVNLRFYILYTHTFLLTLPNVIYIL